MNGWLPLSDASASAVQNLRKLELLNRGKVYSTLPPHLLISSSPSSENSPPQKRTGCSSHLSAASRSFLHVLALIASKLTYRDARRKRSTSCGPLHGVRPIRGDRSWWPCARGNHACSRGGDCAVEMFFSLFYSVIIVKFHRFGLQNYTNLLNYARNIRNLAKVFMFFTRKCVPLHPETVKYILLLGFL